MNTSGMKPINLNVLVLPDEVEEKTAGGLYIADTTKDKNRHQQTRGTLIDLCEDAFKEMAVKPKPGDRVIFAKFEGVVWDGDDGKQYRLLKDIDVVGVEYDSAPRARVAATTNIAIESLGALV